MKTILLILFSVCFYASQAQQPWRAKLIVYFEGPNPVHDYLQLGFTKWFSARLMLYDNMGRLQHQQQIKQGKEAVVEVKHLISGVYYLLLFDSDNGSSQSVKVLKE